MRPKKNEPESKRVLNGDFFLQDIFPPPPLPNVLNILPTDTPANSTTLPRHPLHEFYKEIDFEIAALAREIAEEERQKILLSAIEEKARAEVSALQEALKQHLVATLTCLRVDNHNRRKTIEGLENTLLSLRAKNGIFSQKRTRDETETLPPKASQKTKMVSAV